jgi:hypothetical protein
MNEVASRTMLKPVKIPEVFRRKLEKLAGLYSMRKRRSTKRGTFGRPFPTSSEISRQVPVWLAFFSLPENGTLRARKLLAELRTSPPILGNRASVEDANRRGNRAFPLTIL